MIEDVYEPLARYRDEFRGKFARLAREKFEELTAASGVDVAANRRLVAEVRKLERAAASAQTRKSCWGCLAAVAFLAGIAALCWAINRQDHLQAFGGYAGLVGGCVLGCAAFSFFSGASRELEGLRESIRRKRDEGFLQMAPLNQIYTWDITVRLIEATVPRLQFDPFFTARRLADLERLYGWDGSFEKERSILFAQSGVINGNPFVFAEALEMNWGTATYVGSLKISWMEWEEDDEGHRRRVRRHETLTAKITKPKPEYLTRKFLVYGNDAAPHLRFTREPSDLSGADDGFFTRLKMKRQVKRLQAFSRNLEDQYPYTLMGNHEFEALFKTTDRFDEVEYRLLFTPVAQLQMLALLKDRTVGYGDDFHFWKLEKINMLFARHLDVNPLDTDPVRFRDWDWQHAKDTFLAFNESYFRNVYFALAPFLAIPLYQQTRTHEEIWRGILDSHAQASSWEHEAAANYHGEKAFRHPRCVTRSILKTKVLAREDGSSQVAVTAHGYEGVRRVHYESVYGGDGEWHDVPIEWTEYLPVQNTRDMAVAEREKGTGRFARDFDASSAAVFRRSIYSFLMPQTGKRT